MKTFILKNEFLELHVSDYGATITSLKFNGSEQVLKYDSQDGYANGSSYVCATIGRYANRIGNSCFRLNGKEYSLVPNENGNQLHSGPHSVDKRNWDAEESSGSIKMSILSPDGDNGFPGNLKMSVTFSLIQNSLRIDFEGETDATTVFAPTSHPYFVLSAPRLAVNSHSHLELDGGNIPTGRVLINEGKYDYSSMRELIDALDDCFILDSQHALTLETNGVTLDVFTDFPAVQIYTGEFLGSPFSPRDGIAIEAEFYPDSPNHCDFPSTVLKPGEKFKKFVEYRFS